MTQLLPRTSTPSYAQAQQQLRALELGDTLTLVVRALHDSRMPLTTTVGAIEKRYIECVLEACRGNKSHAAAQLGMHRNTLDRHIAALNIEYWKFAPRQFARSVKRKQLYASKERSACGELAAGRSALAPNGPQGRAVFAALGRGSADYGQRQVNLSAGASASATPGFTNSVRKGGRGESPEPSRGGQEVATAGTAHLAQSSKPPRGFIPDDFDQVECGGPKS